MDTIYRVTYEDSYGNVSQEYLRNKENVDALLGMRDDIEVEVAYCDWEPYDGNET